MRAALHHILSKHDVQWLVIGRNLRTRGLFFYQPFVILSNLCTGGPEADTDGTEQRVQADAAAWKDEAEKPLRQTDYCILQSNVIIYSFAENT